MVAPNGDFAPPSRERPTIEWCDEPELQITMTSTDYRNVWVGYVVGTFHEWTGQQWWFYGNEEEALQFGVLARKSLNCRGYGVYRAVFVRAYDDRKGDQDMLFIGKRSIERAEEKTR